VVQSNHILVMMGKDNCSRFRIESLWFGVGAEETMDVGAVLPGCCTGHVDEPSKTGEKLRQMAERLFFCPEREV